MAFDFKNKVAIITGSSQGIGKETAIQLCELGCKVVLNGRTLSKLEATRDELLAKGLDVDAIQGDVTSIEDCQNLIDKTVEKFGRLDILINNGSLTMNERFDQLQPEVYKAIFDSNSSGAVYPTMAALPHLKKTKGSIIFISSLAGFHGLPAASAYSMGKMSLTPLWQSLRIELTYTGIHFGIVHVSFTQNEDQKRMVTSDGSLIPVPKRPSFIQQPREKVARSIIRMIKYRRKRKVLSPLGKITAFMMRFFPRLVLSIMIQVQKKKNVA